MRIGALLALGVVSAALFAASTDRAGADEAKLKAANFLPAKASFGWPFVRWVDEVNKRCDGLVEISVVGPEAIKAFEQPKALSAGVIDVLHGPPAYYQGDLVEGDAAVLSDYTAPEQRKNGAWEYLNRLHNEKLNAWYLTYFGDGMSFYIWTTKPAKNGRFDGMTLRSVPIYKTFFEGLGASTTTIAPPEVYTALERGTVDGYGWPLWGIADFGWDKFTKYRYEPGFFRVVTNVLINLDRWKGFSAEQRQCLNEMAVWGEEMWPSWRDEYTAQELKKLEKSNISVVNLGAGHAKTAHDLYWARLEKESPDNIRALKKLLTK